MLEMNRCEGLLFLLLRVSDVYNEAQEGDVTIKKQETVKMERMHVS